jgi:hypothetical protein
MDSQFRRSVFGDGNYCCLSNVGDDASLPRADRRLGFPPADRPSRRSQPGTADPNLAAHNVIDNRRSNMNTRQKPAAPPSAFRFPARA